MNKIEELIQHYCPNGVEFTEIGKIGDFYGGLTGKSKNDFQNGNAKFVTYMNVFSNITVKTDINIFVRIGNNENQNRVEYGDVLFTGSSETPDECGMSSVLTEKITEPLFLNSFCFGYRLRDKDLFLPDFMKYLFRDDNIRRQIGQTASGVTRFNVSKKRFAKVLIPIPPLPIQQEIVTILDKFTQLQAELQARRAQYEYYRNELLNFEGKEVEWKTLGEVCIVSSGGTPSKAEKSYWTNGTIPWLKSEVCKEKSVFSAKDNITELGLKKSGAKLFCQSTTLMALVGATKCKTAFLEFEATTNQNIAGIKSKDENLLLDKFVFYYLMNLYKELIKNLGQYDMLNLGQIREYKIPIPPLAGQNRIVAILDKFDKLVNDISEGLPAEIQARQKQYEYYRGKLLEFEPLRND